MAESLGGIDILVNCAGGVRGQVAKPIEEVSEQEWLVLFEANVHGAFWCSQAVAPHMKRQKFGRIVNISSGAGLRPSLTGIQAYTASKHALVGLTKQLSFELGPTASRSTAWRPASCCRTRPRSASGRATGRRSGAPRGEHPHPPPRASAGHRQRVMFLASDAAAWVSGQIISVDGGRS